ncbi:MAG: VanW family protein [Actinomycetota bacterium]
MSRKAPWGKLPERLPRPLGLALVAVVAVGLLAALALGAGRLLRSGILPNVRVVTSDLGTLSEEEARAALEDLEGSIAQAELTIVREETGRSPTRRFVTTREELGYQLDVDATLVAAAQRGRQTNPAAALADHVMATFGTIDVDPVHGFDRASARRWLEIAAGELSDPAFPGGFEAEGTDISPLYPEPGTEVQPAELRRAVRQALDRPSAARIAVTAADVEPPTNESDVDRLVRRVRRAVSAPVELTRSDSSLSFAPEDIAGLLEARVTGEELELFVPKKSLRRFVKDDIDELETEPQDASFQLRGDTVQVVPSRKGFSFSPKAAARQLVKVATTAGERTAELAGDEIEPDFSTKDAKGLNITEQVSSFTTYHPCCEPRVENIHRIADLVDGVVVKPGESFSINDHVGPRTTAKGFVAAPAIRDGEIVQEVGGGISQFATTFFNAIFFGGYDFLEYQAHSYYYDRYPRGREATVSTPAPDLAFRNDSDAGIYIDTSYTDTSISVAFYGRTDANIEAVMGEPFDQEPPTEQCRRNDSLNKGEDRVVQQGNTGFQVIVKRLFRNNGTEEVFRTRYQMQPRIVERRRC